MLFRKIQSNNNNTKLRDKKSHEYKGNIRETNDNKICLYPIYRLGNGDMKYMEQLITIV